MHKATIIANTADQRDTLPRTVQTQPHSLLDTGSQNAPVRYFALVGCGQIEGLPSSVAGSERSVVRIQGVNLNVKQPMDRRRLYIRSKAVVVLAPAAEDRSPVRTAIGGTENIFATRSEERRVGKECRSRWSP